MAAEFSAARKDMKILQLNDQKAGMEGLDKEAINKIIFEASKGTPYFSFQEKRQQRIDRRVQEMLEELQKVTDLQKKDSMSKMDLLCTSLEEERDLSRSIVHIDMDAFYAAVEMRDNPDFKSKPMAVGSSSMLSTSNYAARKFGVRAAMPGFIAKKLCPELVIVPCNFDKYRQVSKQIKAIVREYDPNSYAASLDEMYFDLTDYINNLYYKEQHLKNCESNHFSDSQDLALSDQNIGSDFMKCKMCSKNISYSMRDKFAFDIVQEIRDRIFKSTQLTASAGIAPNTMLAKVCSDQNKPNGQFQIPSDCSEVKKFIETLLVKKVSGIGPVQSQLLNALGIHTCSDLYKKRELVNLMFSPNSIHFYMRVALGLGSTLVKSDYVRKSIGTEVTFREIHKPEDLHQKCQDLCSELTEDLKSRTLMGKVLVLKIKTVDFQSHTRNATLPCYTSDGEVIMNAAKRLLDNEIRAVAPTPLKLRLMGIRMANLVDESEVADVKQARLENFLTPRAGSLSEPHLGTTSPSTSKSRDLYICPICNDESATTLNAFNKHIDQCLATDSTNSNSSARLPFESSHEAICGIGKGETEDIKDIKNNTTNINPLVCPVCGLEQKSSELSDLNVHIDSCLSKCAIKEILSSDCPVSNSLAKRKPANKSKKRKTENRTLKTIDHYFH